MREPKVLGDSKPNTEARRGRRRRGIIIMLLAGARKSKQKCDSLALPRCRTVNANLHFLTLLIVAFVNSASRVCTRVKAVMMHDSQTDHGSSRSRPKPGFSEFCCMYVQYMFILYGRTYRARTHHAPQQACVISTPARTINATEFQSHFLILWPLLW